MEISTVPDPRQEQLLAVFERRKKVYMKNLACGREGGKEGGRGLAVSNSSQVFGV